MIDYVPYSEMPKIEPKPIIAEKKEYQNIQSFNTKEKAVEYINKHGGYLTRGVHGRYQVIFIPKDR